MGQSAGARLSLFAAVRHPGVVAGVAVLNITAGPLAADVLSTVYYRQVADAAEHGGMPAVLAMAHYRDVLRSDTEVRAAPIGPQLWHQCQRFKLSGAHYSVTLHN